MAGHPDHAYFAYLPEPVFFSSSLTHSIALHSLVLQRAPDDEVDLCRRAREHPRLLSHQNDDNNGDVEMSGATDSQLDQCQPSVRQRLSSSVDYRCHGHRHDRCPSVQSCPCPDESAGAMPVTSTLTIHRERAGQHGAHFHSDESGLIPGRTHSARHGRMQQTRRTDVLPPELTGLAMQMVVRSQHSLSTAPDSIARPDSAVDQATFDALVASAEAIDEDALTVNHPCRLFDVANFLGRWSYGRYMGNTCLPIGVNIDAQLHRIDQRRRVVRVPPHTEDMQGIDWDSLGTTRQHALEARSLLRPVTSQDHQGLQCCNNDDLLQDRFYRFQSFHARHRARFAHYQLRHMLTASSRSNIFYAAGSSVSAASLAFPTSQAVVMDLSKTLNTALPFQITCLASSSAHTSQNVLFAGSTNGEFAMLSPDVEHKSSPVQGHVSHDYNGLITHVTAQPHRQSGVLQATFSSNDSHVRTMDVQTCRFVSEHKYSSSINATATSPDGRLRLLAGDTCDTLLVDAERGVPVLTLSAHAGFGFACAWSADSRYAATAAQDGRTNVWDTRNWATPLNSLHSEMSCVRSLNFTDDNVLVMAENEDVISLWDVARQRRQGIRFFGSIAGVALLDGGAEIAVANADRTVGGLLVFDRDGGSETSDRRMSSSRWCTDRSLPRKQRRAQLSDTVEELVI